MADHTLPTAREQAIKAARYFKRVMEEGGADYLAVRVDGVVLLAARGEKSEPQLSELVKSWGGALQEPRPYQLEDVPDGDVRRAIERTDRAIEQAEHEGSSKNLHAQEVVLIPMFHVPPPEFATKKSYVHLHVLNDAKVGRRVRHAGECICGKKHGSQERVPQDGETEVCPECARVAHEAGVAWSL